MISKKGKRFSLTVDGGLRETPAPETRFNSFHLNDISLPKKLYEHLINEGTGIIGNTQFRKVATSDGSAFGLSFNSIDPNSLLGRTGIKPGDVITAINGYDIHSPEDILSAVLDRSEFRLVIFFQRNNVPGSVAVGMQSPV